MSKVICIKTRAILQDDARFEKIARENREKREKLAEQRKQDNKNTLRSYRIK